jgi:hypothetical protein
MSFHISGSTRFSLGLGLAEVLPESLETRDGRSAAFVPGAPKLEGPIEGIVRLVYLAGGPEPMIALRQQHYDILIRMHCIPEISRA